MLFRAILNNAVVLIGLVSAASRTSPPSGCLVVRSSGAGNGEYSTLQAAVDKITSSTTNRCIFVYSGTYSGGVTYIKNKGPLTIYGYTTETANYKNNVVTFTNKLGSSDAGSLDASSTINIASSDVKVYNINVENTYGTAGQAVALTGNGMRLGFYGCSFKSYQDTLYAKSGDQYYSNCYIEGAVDYAFGNANAWFGECTFASSGGGYITATSRTYDNDTAWYVIDHSTVTNKVGVDVTNKVFLGRPWRQQSRVIYQYSTLTGVVHPDGWAPMSEGATPHYYEYSNTGAGSDTSKRKYLSSINAAVTKKTIWPDGYSWIDSSY